MAAIVLILAWPACSSSRPEGDAIVVAIANSPVNLDPRVGADEASQKAHQLLYSTLVKIDKDLSVVPDLAETFERVDPITYVATLRHGVLFHNGRELTSDDVVYTFRSLLDPAFRGRTGAYRQQLAAVVAKDRYTVEFKLTKPFGSFPINLVMGIVQAGSGDANARSPIGTGPYRMKTFVQDDRLVLEPFDGYYGERARNSGVVLKVVPDDTMRGLELRKGTVDLVVNDLAPDIVWELRTEGRLGVATAEGTDYAYMGLNQQDPVLAERNRQARHRLCDRSPGDRQISASRVGAGGSGHRAAHVVGVRARGIRFHLRSGAGKAVARRGRLRGSRRRRAVAAIRPLAQDVDLRGLSGAGRRDSARSRARRHPCRRQVERAADAVRGRAARQLSALHAAMGRRHRSGHAAPRLSLEQVPPAGLNRVHYINPEVDRLIDDAAVAVDEEARGVLYKRAQQLIAEDVPYVSLWYKTNVAVFQPEITGVRLSPIADFTFLKDLSRAGHGVAGASAGAASARR